MIPASFQTRDGLTLRCGVEAPLDPKASLVLLHGLGDHREALPYRLFRAFLVQRGVAVFSFDLRGHGESEGRRMFTPGWSWFRDDLRRFVERVDQPVFLCGISLGGLMALDFALHEPARLPGVIAMAPAVTAAGVPGPLRWLLPKLARIVPRLAIQPGLDLKGISRDTDLVREYTRDPGFQRKTTARLAAEVMAAMSVVTASAPSLRVPLLVQHGEADTIVPAAGSAGFFASAGATDKTRLTYPEALHNLLIEANRQEVYEDTLRWMLHRAG